MKKKTRFIFSRLAMITLTVGILLSGHTEMGHVNAAVATQCTTYSGSNINAQNYTNWSTTVKSYLTTTDDGYMRVQSNASTDGYLVEYYDTDYNFQESKVIPVELPIWGAFYETEDNYYILSGQNNSEESNDVEVYRITKYDKNWERIDSCGLFGANTYIPFSAGSARMAHSGNQLIIHTCHEMYESSDKLHHQANVTIQVNMSEMKITDSFTNVATIEYGYASHSFNQFVGIDDNHIISVNHGDAYPRSIVLVKYPAYVSSEKFTSSKCNVSNLVKFDGEIGNNYTGATIGGFAISGSSYIVVGNQNINFDNKSDGCNIFVLSQNKTTGEITRTDITNYAKGNSVSTPQLVTLGANSYLLLWYKDGSTYYTKLDGTGAPVGNTYSLEGALSDCVPIVANGKVIWYTWKNGDITFYEINTSDLSMNNTVLIENGHKYQYSDVDSNGMIAKTCIQCGDTAEYTAPTYFELYWGGLYTSASPRYTDRFKTGDKYYAWRYKVDGDSEVNEIEFISSNPDIVSTEYYDINYEQFNMNSPGIAQVTARLKYNPSVSKSYIFRVGADGEISLKDCILTMDDHHYYTGRAIEPTFTLTYKGQSLVKDTDYTVKYSNNTAVGTGTVTITGQGIFGGEITTDFEIADVLIGLEVEGTPEHTEYYYGDTFNMTGLTVTALFESGAREDVTNLVNISALSEGNTEIVLSYTHAGITKEYVLKGITVKKKPEEELKKEESIKDTEASEDESKELPNPNSTVTDTKTGVSYKITQSDAANGTVEYIGAGKNAKGTVSIPATVNLNGISYKVTSVAKDAFKGNKSITKVTVGKNITTIGKNAFSGCTKLKTVTLGSNVTKIEEKAFYNCKALKKITIPAQVNKIGKNAFANCKNLNTITIKTTKLNKSKVGSNAFKGIAANSTIKVPAKKLSEYKKILLARGVGKKAKIKK